MNLQEIKNKVSSNCDLPDKPNYKKIREFVMDTNEKIVKGDFNV